MKLKPLHDRFIENVKAELPDWKFISSQRHFRKSVSEKNLYIHISLINHEKDFDAVINVAIEFLHKKERICIVGAELGNIEGIGQFRHSVTSEQSAKQAAINAKTHIEKVGLPFFERFSNPSNVLSALKTGGKEAILISPLINQHPQQIAALEVITNAG